MVQYNDYEQNVKGSISKNSSSLKYKYYTLILLKKIAKTAFKHLKLTNT